jgi:hypothetical protein
MIWASHNNTFIPVYVCSNYTVGTALFICISRSVSRRERPSMHWQKCLYCLVRTDIKEMFAMVSRGGEPPLPWGTALAIFPPSGRMLRTLRHASPSLRTPVLSAALPRDREGQCCTCACCGSCGDRERTDARVMGVPSSWPEGHDILRPHAPLESMLTGQSMVVRSIYEL